MTDVAQHRQAIIAAIPHETASEWQSISNSVVYVPPAHIKALRLESSLVVGGRGVGKSFWTKVLSNPSFHTLLGTSMRELSNVKVCVGYSADETITNYPNPDVFAELMRSGYTPYEIWTTIVLWCVATMQNETIASDTWNERTQWVKENPEPVAELLQRANQQFNDEGKRGLIIFDALDRTSNDWDTMDRITRDLFRLVLRLKSYTAIDAKVFLREDQLDRTVTDFPDASKLLATKAEISWQLHDLHGLLWQYLCNAREVHGTILRNVYKSIAGDLSMEGSTWMISQDAKREGNIQRDLFHSLSGPWMGTDKRRGVPYIWSVSHLSDAYRRTSPRSFLIAIRSAAEDSEERYPNHNFSLHYESIKQGVQKASKVRVNEIEEDHPWVKKIITPLEGLTIPCEFSTLENIWKQEWPEGLSLLPGERLPPQHAADGWIGIKKDLERLGLCETMKDGRFNMPDLYRVGFGLGRKGGVKPLEKK